MDLNLISLIVFFSMLGSVTNYLIHKSEKKRLNTITERSIILKLFFGWVAGLLLASSFALLIYVEQIPDVDHWFFYVIPAFLNGAVSEKYIARILNRGEDNVLP